MRWAGDPVVDARNVAEAGVAFHWQRTESLDVLPVTRAPWQPREMFECGWLYELHIDGVCYRVRTGEVWVAGGAPLYRYGGEERFGPWDLFIVPAIAPPAVGRLQRIVYTTQKGNDPDLIHYDHPFEGPHLPWVQDNRGAMHIDRGPLGQRSEYVLTEAGIRG